MVSHGGTSYMCISNVSGTTTPNADASNWDSMAVKGDIGVTGSQGVTGNTGSQGPIGVTGSQGPIGVTGSQGPIGVTGSQGPIGVTGISGFPSGGAPGQVVTNTGSGVGTWADVDATLVSAVEPTIGTVGVLFYNTDSNILHVSDGSVWNPVYEPPLEYLTVSVKSCAELGFENTNGGDICGDCMSTAGVADGCSSGDWNWDTYRAHCEDNGARLCSKDELAAGENSGTGCGWDSNAIWTSTPGPNSGEYWYVQGDYLTSGIGFSASKTTTIPSGMVVNQFGLRCCGDV
jgi:hypothetical protein